MLHVLSEVPLPVPLPGDVIGGRTGRLTVVRTLQKRRFPIWTAFQLLTETFNFNAFEHIRNE